jgi:hypothetical protein
MVLRDGVACRPRGRAICGCPGPMGLGVGRRDRRLRQESAIGLRPSDLSVTTSRDVGPRPGTSLVRIEGAYPIHLVASRLVFGRDSIQLRYTARAALAE